MTTSTKPQKPIWPIYAAAVMAFFYAALDLFGGISLFQLPARMATMPFPYNAFANSPELKTMVTWGANILIVLSTAFFLGGLGIFIKRKWGFFFAIFAAFAQIAGTIYMAIFYYNEVFPVISEIFLLAGPPENAWLYDIGGVVLIGEIATMLPEMILIFILLLSSHKKFFSR